MDERIIFHIDFDYFYAQCEEKRNPELKNKAVVVCVYSNRGNDNGAVATANYIARKYNVKSGMPIKFAHKRLENVESKFLPVDFDYYTEISQTAMKIIRENSDIFEYVGRDEAYIDVTKKVKNDFGKATLLAQEIKDKIQKNMELTCSVGVSPNKLLSKIASDYKKPDGLTTVTPKEIDGFLNGLKIRDIPGIGQKTEDKLAEMNLDTVMELKKIDVFTLNQKFGRKTGAHIFNAVRGIDTEQVKERDPNIQYSKIITLKENSKNYDVLHAILDEICVQLHDIVKKNNKMFKSVGMQFFQSDLSSKTKSKMLRNPTNDLEELKKASNMLLREALEGQELLIRRLGVKVSELTDVKGQENITNYF